MGTPIHRRAVSGITLLQGDSDEDTQVESDSDGDADADMHVDLMDVDEDLTENEKAARHRHEIGGARDMFSGRVRHQQSNPLSEGLRSKIKHNVYTDETGEDIQSLSTRSKYDTSQDSDDSDKDIGNPFAH